MQGKSEGPPHNSLAYIALGSNIDAPTDRIEEALYRLKTRFVPKIQVLRVSSLWSTPPWGPVEQDDFVNAVVEIETAFLPEELLQAVLQIEKEMCRERLVRWGPRRIDLDLLAYDAIQYNSNTLTLPHPRWAERAFVLLPWTEISPDFRPHPRGMTLCESLMLLPANELTSCLKLSRSLK